MTLLALSLLACDPSVKETGDTADTGVDTDTAADTDTDTDSDTDTDTDTDTDSATPPPQHWELVATTTDYTTGALVTIDEDDTLTDNVLPISSDAAVIAEADHVFVLNRSSENTVQVFQGGDYSAPALEFSTGDGSNPVAAATCGGKLFVAVYFAANIPAYDPASGLQVGAVDLAEFSDADGSPETGGLYVAPNGYLYATLQQLDYGGSYEALDGSGTLVKVDCASLEVVDSWDIGPNPRLDEHPSQPGTMVLTGGNYYNDDYSGPELDGGVWTFDTQSDTLAGPFLTEKDVGYNIGGIAGLLDGKAMTTFDDGYSWQVVCLDVNTWTYTVAAAENVYVGSSVASPDGRVWMAQARGYGGGSGVPTTGFVPYDPYSCTMGEALHSGLGPSSLAVRRF